MIPQLKTVRRERRDLPGREKRQQTPAELAAGELARLIIRALELEDTTDTWRTIRAVSLAYLWPDESSPEEPA